MASVIVVVIVVIVIVVVLFFHACDEVTELSDVNREASISERTQPELTTTSIIKREHKPKEKECPDIKAHQRPT